MLIFDTLNNEVLSTGEGTNNKAPQSDVGKQHSCAKTFAS